MDDRRIGSGVYATLALLILMAAPPVFAGTAGGVTLDVVPSQSMISPDGTVDVDVVISGLGNFSSPGVRTFDMDLTFDPAIFSLVATVVGPFLGDPMAMPPEALVTITPGASDVGVLEVSLLATPDLLALQPDSFVLFTASFDAVGTGEGVFDLSVAALGDENADPLPVEAINSATVSTFNVLEIPTLSEWSLILLTLLLMTAALLHMGRVRS